MVTIIYASTSGNVELVCEYVAEMLANQELSTSMHRAELTEVDVLKNHKYFVLATSTWEHGEINPYFQELLNEMKSLDLKGKYAGFIGLGDHRYEPVYFARGVDILEKVFTANGGKKLCETLKIDGDPHEILDQLVKVWVDKFILMLQNQSGK